MLAKDGLDAVLVLTQPAATYGVAKDFLAAGVPTLMEKPPGMSTAETRDLLATACSTGTNAMVAVNRRFNPLLTEARRMVEARGRIASIVAECYQFSSPLYRRMVSTEEPLAPVTG